MILKLKLKNIDDNYAWHFVDGVENVAVEKSELGNIKSITYYIYSYIFDLVDSISSKASENKYDSLLLFKK